MNDFADLDARAVVAGIRRRSFTAAAVLDAALTRIHRDNARLNCFTTVVVERATRRAAALDAAVARGETVGALAGVPFGVKNLFDIAGVVTVAGSKIHREHPPAAADATVIRHLEAAGAVLIGALNMDEYAYGFTTENSHDGPTRNPHDPSRMAGGSSGGSAAAVAAGMVPISLGSDTNGSIRVPAAFCGVFGLKPTYGRLSRAGTVGFVASLDHVGPFARTVGDLALVYDLMQGPDPTDPAQAERAREPVAPAMGLGLAGLRIGVLSGWFREGASDTVLDAVDRAAVALNAVRRFTLPEVQRARAAAFCISAAEGGNQHFADLQRRAGDFDPATRDRLLAGALLPAHIVIQAQRLRRWFHRQVMGVFEDVDVLLAPATPVSALPLGATTMPLGEQTVLARPNLGIYTQPLSFIGLPVVAAPIPGAMPVAVQIIAPPWREDWVLRVAAALEDRGIAAAPVAIG